MRIGHFVLLLGLFCLPFSAPALAVDGDCDSLGSDEEKVLAACKNIIDNQANPDEQRVEAYQQRSTFYLRKARDPDLKDPAEKKKLLTLADQDMADALKLDPDDPFNYIFRSYVFSEAKDFERALAILNEGLQVSPDDTAILWARATYWGDRKDYDRQIADCTKLIELEPRNSRHYRMRSEAWKAKGDDAKAAADARMAASLEEQAKLLRFSPENKSVEPVEISKSTYFIGRNDTPVYEEPSETAAVVKTLDKGEKVQVTGRTRNSRNDKERWFALAYADGKERFVKGAALLDEEEQEARAQFLFYKQRLEKQRGSYLAPFDAIEKSPPGDRKYVGLYTLGDDCNLTPAIVKQATGAELASLRAQIVKYAKWANESYFFWTDNNYSYFSHPYSGETRKFRYRFITKKTYGKMGSVAVFHQEIVSGGSETPLELSRIGIVENGKLLLVVTLSDKNRHIAWEGVMTRCNNMGNAKAAVSSIYEEYKKSFENLLAYESR